MSLFKRLPKANGGACRMVSEESVSLFERVEKEIQCHDRMRRSYRPDIPGMSKTRATAERMSDLARGLGSALLCREKDEIDVYMTAIGKALVDVKNLINSKPAKIAFDAETAMRFPERRELKTVVVARA